MQKVQKPKSYARMTKREKSDLKRTIKTQNAKLERLEKAGLAGASTAYKSLEAQYEGGANWLYRDKNGNIRFKGNISKMSAAQIADIKEQTRRYRQTKTGTKTGTKTAQKKMAASYNAMLAKHGIKPKKPLKPSDIRQLHESDAFKKLEEIYGYYMTVKIIEENPEMTTKEFEELAKIAYDEDADIEIFLKLLEEGDAFVKVAERVGLTRDDVQKLQLQTGFFDLMTPEQFAVFAQKAAQIADTDGTPPADELENLIKNSYYF